MHSMMIEKPCAGEMGHTIFFSGIRGRDKSIYELHRRLEHMHVCLSCKETAREPEKKACPLQGCMQFKTWIGVKD